MDAINQCTCAGHLAMATVPKQEWCEPYDCEIALTEGTIFPCLNLTFYKAPANQKKLKSCSSLSNKDERDREEMMTELSAISFMLNDLTLYLDTHPDCPNGTPLFHELLAKRLELLSEFAQRFYPLTHLSMVTGEFDENRYGWSEGPMPWEGACI